jgi:two-component system, NtrC family, response regulator AtoC
LGIIEYKSYISIQFNFKKITVAKIFIVEDDLFYSKLIRHKLSMDPEFEVQIFNDGKSLLEYHEEPEVITLDYSLPDYSGLEILPKITARFPNSQVIILSAQENVSTAIEMLKKGAYDYIVKDEEAMNKLWHIVHKSIEHQELKNEVRVLTEGISSKYAFRDYIKGNSETMQRVFELLEKTVYTSINVVITGETGTGKEVVAKAIHYNSNRSKHPFVALNVSAIPKELIESEMFGYEKGAFTGADKSKPGKFEEAHKGTIFLDEIGELDITVQAKLLRVLQEREVTRLGSNKSILFDTRILVATHRNLLEEVKAGRFREDLFYRLLGISIDLPPLREREGDILILANLFIKEFCKSNQISKKELSKEAIRKLNAYHFPGNVRELKAIVEIAAVMCNGDIISGENIVFHQSHSFENLLNNELTLEQYNAKIIQRFLEQYNWNVVKVAEKLDIGKSTIYRMIKEGEIVK